LSDHVDSILLKQPLSSVSSNRGIDLHRLYLVDELPSLVETFIRSNLNPEEEVSLSGWVGPSPSTADELVVSLPISGPHEYLAQIVYGIVPVGTSASEVRVDAQTIWEPKRSSKELISSHSGVDLTGYARTSFVTNALGPVAIKLDHTQAKRVTTIADDLPLAPLPACMESAIFYKLVFRSTEGSDTTFELEGTSCGSTVLVTRNGQRLSPLHDGTCSLLHAVIALLPRNKANGTRHALSDCTSR
jgi:hypothetical protein